MRTSGTHTLAFLCLLCSKIVTDNFRNVCLVRGSGNGHGTDAPWHWSYQGGNLNEGRLRRMAVGSKQRISKLWLRQHAAGPLPKPLGSSRHPPESTNPSKPSAGGRGPDVRKTFRASQAGFGAYWLRFRRDCGLVVGTDLFNRFLMATEHQHATKKHYPNRKRRRQ